MFSFAPTDDEGAWYFEFIVGVESASDAVIGFDDVGACLFSLASSFWHGNLAVCDIDMCR